MKMSLFISMLAVIFVTGCTTIESTQKFNRMGLGTKNEKAVCHTFVEIPGYYLFGLPIFVGSPAGDGEWTMFRNNLTTENAVYLLTREAKSRKAARVVNVNVHRTSASVSIFPFLSYRTIQASGTGVRTKDAAVNTAIREFDRQP